MKTVILIGADPEIFVRSSENAQLISAHNLIPGTKKEPHKVPFGAVQVDGMALEFNIDPASTEEQFKHNIEHVMSSLKSMIVHDFVIEPVAHFGKEFMEQQPAEALELGCDPDYDAYTKEPNPRPDGEVPFRTASGHIHVGWGESIPADHPEHINVCSSFIKTMDHTVGFYMTILDDDNRRRELYGKAGAFRPKSYGVEYRTPSNVWLTTARSRRAIFELTLAATRLEQQKVNGLLTQFVDDDEAQRIINEGDYEKAHAALVKLFPWRFTNERKSIDAAFERRRAA